MPDLSREVLESKYKLYRRSTAVLAIVCAFLGIVLIGQFVMGPAADPTEPASSGSPERSHDSSVVLRDPDDAMAIGEVDAPVVLVQWTDMRCPFCASFHRDTLPALVDDYVETGKVRIEVHVVAYFGKQSEDAAIAARAAANQGRFSEYLDAVYAAAPDKGHPDLSREDLIAFANTAGVPDIEKFTADLDSTELRAKVQETTTTAQGLGVSAVPFFVAGDTALSGAQPVDIFRQFLDQAMAEAE